MKSTLKDWIPPMVLRGLRRVWPRRAGRAGGWRNLGAVRLEQPKEHSLCLHLGCGGNVLPGWANYDLIELPGVIVHDLNRPLPVGSRSVDLIFSEHFVEHVSCESARQLFLECKRVLRPGGRLRISTPDLRTLVARYLAGNLTEWEDVGWSPESPCKMLNDGLRLWGHEFVYDFEELSRQLASCGFRSIRRVEWHSSEEPRLRQLECRPFHGDLIVEADR